MRTFRDFIKTEFNCKVGNIFEENNDHNDNN